MKRNIANNPRPEPNLAETWFINPVELLPKLAMRNYDTYIGSKQKVTKSKQAQSVTNEKEIEFYVKCRILITW